MPTITKLAILVDPNKKEKSEYLYNTILTIINENKDRDLPLEVWVGDSKEIYHGVHRYVKKFHRDIGHLDIPIVIFPGHPLQISKYADNIMLPTLLNTHRFSIKVILKLGKKYHWLFKWWSRLWRHSFPKDRKYGYMILRSESTVGRKLKAKNLTDEEAYREITSKWRKYWDWIYLEAGSGNFQYTIAKRTDLVKRVADFAHSKGAKLITGGGISTVEDVENLIKAGSDLIVVSTAFEVAEDAKKLIEEFLEVLMNFQ